MANATISLDHMLASYPAPIALLAVQFPDPHFKARHRKRRTVQARGGGAAAAAAVGVALTCDHCFGCS